MATLTFQYISDTNQIWLNGTGAVGFAWSPTISGIPSGATVNSVALSFDNGHTYNIPGSCSVYWGTSTSGTRLWNISGSNQGSTASVDLTSYITGNGTYNLYFYKTANNGSTQSNVYFTDVIITVTYTATATTTYTACTAPTTVTISKASVAPGESVTLSWSGAKSGTNNAIAGYHVYRSTSASGTYTKTYSVTTSSASGSVAVTAPSTVGSAYYFKVYTIGKVSGYNSAASKYASLTCAYTSPSAPTSVTVSNASPEPGESVTLSWSGAKTGTNNTITGYRIYRATSSGGTYKFLKSVTSSSTSGSCAVIAHSSMGGSYYYKVYTVGTYSNSAASSYCAVTSKSYSACIAPTIVYLQGTLSHDSVKLIWSGAADGGTNVITGYQVWRSESSNGTSWGDWSLCTTTAADKESCSVSPPSTYGNYYRYRVRAICAAGESYYSPWKQSVNTLRRDHAPIETFTDTTLVAKKTPIKAIHMTELQSKINLLLDFYGLGAQKMTSIVAGTTSLGGWTNHVNEVRSAVDVLTSYHDSWLNIPVNCPRADVTQQLRDVILYVEKPKAVLGVAKLGAMVI